jgi:hypothetical protein
MTAAAELHTARWRSARRAARAVLVTLLAGAVLLVGVLPHPHRAVLLLTGLTLAAALVAAVTRWRIAGTLTVIGATSAVLLAGALDDSALRPAQIVLDAVLLVGLVAALAANEDTRDLSGPGDTVLRAPLGRRVGPLAAGVVAAGVVAVTAAQDVVPSVPLVLAGLAAAVAALVLAAGGHRS